MNNLKFFKNSPKRKAIACQILLLGLTGMIAAGIPIDHIVSQYLFDLAYCVIFGMAAKFQYYTHNQENQNKNIGEIDYLNEMNDEYQERQHERDNLGLSQNDDNLDLRAEQYRSTVSLGVTDRDPNRYEDKSQSKNKNKKMNKKTKVEKEIKMNNLSKLESENLIDNDHFNLLCAMNGYSQNQI